MCVIWLFRWAITYNGIKLDDDGGIAVYVWLDLVLEVVILVVVRSKSYAVGRSLLVYLEIGSRIAYNILLYIRLDVRATTRKKKLKLIVPEILHNPLGRSVARE